tara:strand:- start:3291 stop:3971 length:681 start_codon:yes stop_codon:yes gene_type:complete
MLSNLGKRTITSFILIVLLFTSLFYNEFSWKALVILFSILCLYEFNNLIRKIYKNKLIITISLLLVMSYLYFFYFLLIKIRSEYGEEAILILLISCFFSDIGGYFVGKTIGGPKLTSLSPNKTISGAFGSIIFTVIGTSIFLLILNKIDSNSIKLEISFKFYLWLISMSIFCQIGDLLISYMKRKANIKDTGKILPGHGGILDRVDGIILAIPFGVLTYFILFLSL